MPRVLGVWLPVVAIAAPRLRASGNVQKSGCGGRVPAGHSRQERVIRTYPGRGCRCFAHPCQPKGRHRPITVVAVLVNQYVRVEFEEVCNILHGFTVTRSPSTSVPAVAALDARERASSIQFAGPLRLVSRGVALIPVRLRHQPIRSACRFAELRIIKVESGTPPLTELLLVLPYPDSAENAHRYIEEAARRVEVRAAFLGPPGYRQALPADAAI